MIRSKTMDWWIGSSSVWGSGAVLAGTVWAFIFGTGYMVTLVTAVRVK